MTNKQQPVASTMTTKTVTSEKPERENDAREQDSVSTSLHQGPNFPFLASPPNILSLPKSAPNYELCKGTIQNEAQIFIINLPSVSIYQNLSHWQIALRAV